MAGQNKLKDGCILLARVILDSAIWHGTADMLKLFIYLVLNARHNRKPKRYPGFEVKRGKLVTSLGAIAEANQWFERNAVRQWSRQKVSRMLSQLQKQERIEIVADTYGTHIKVCNYEVYQNLEAYKAERSGQKWNSSGTDVDINKYVKKVNNEQKMSPLLQVFNHWNSYKDRSVCKLRDGKKTNITWHSHKLRPDDSLSPDTEKAIAGALMGKHSVEDICGAVDNYAMVLLGSDYWWTHVWPLPTFLMVKYERHKDADYKWWQFLPDSFIENNYLTEPAKTKRENEVKGPSYYDLVKEQSKGKRDGQKQAAC